MNSVKTFAETVITSPGLTTGSEKPVVAFVAQATNSSQSLVRSKLTQTHKRQASLNSPTTNDSNGSAIANSGLFDQSSSTEFEYYRENIASAGSIVHCRSNDTFMPANLPNSVVWRLLDNSKRIELDPVDLNASPSSSQTAKFRPVHLVLPSAIRENCISVCYSPDQFKIVVDYVSQDWAFYTLAIPLSEMVSDDSNSMTNGSLFLTNENAESWYRMEANLPFDLKQPHLVYSVSPNIVIVGLRDGSIIKIFRNSALAPCNWDIFPEPTQSLSLSKFLWGQSDKFPMQHNLSIRTIVSMVATCGNEILITISINRKLRVWHIRTMKLLFEKTLTDSSIENNTSNSKLSQRNLENTLIGPSPMNLLSVLNDSLTTFYFSSYLPLGNGTFEIWSAKLYTSVTASNNEEQVSIDVTNLGPEYQITPEMLDPSAMWLVNTLHLARGNTFTHEKPSFDLSIMWKSNTSSVVCKTSLPCDTPSPTWHVAAIYEDQDKEYLRKAHSPAATRADVYLDWLFGPEGYSPATIQTALQIYGNYYALDEVISQANDDDEDNAKNNINLVLKNKVCLVVGSAVSFNNTNSDLEADCNRYKSAMAKELQRFDRLCTELERLGNEVLSMVWDPLRATFWVIKASFTTIIRPLLPLELCYYNRSATPSPTLTSIVTKCLKSSSALPQSLEPEIDEPFVLRVIQIMEAIYTFRRSFSHAHYSGFVNELIDDYTGQARFSTEERINYVTNNLIDQDMSRETRSALAIAIAEASAGDTSFIFKVFSFIYDIGTLSSTGLSHVESKPSWMTTLGTLCLVRTLYEFTRTMKIVVTDVLISLLSISLGPTDSRKLVKSYTHHLELFKALNAIDEMLRILPAYKSSALKQLTFGDDVDMEMLSSSQKPKLSQNLSVFQNIAYRNQPRAAGILQITCTNIPQLVSTFWLKWNIAGQSTATEEFVAELLSEQNDEAARSFAENYLCSGNNMSSFGAFIRAHAELREGSMSKALDLFKQASTELSQRQLTSNEETVLSKLPANCYCVTVGEKAFPNSAVSFGNGLSAFFNSAARTVDLWGHHTILALQLAKLARTNLPDYHKVESNDEVSRVFELSKAVQNSLFDFAIKATDLDEAYNSIVELDMLHNSSATLQVKLENGTATDIDTESLIVPYVARLVTVATLTGQGFKLTSYPFIGLANVVTNFLMAKARKTFADAVQAASAALKAAQRNAIVNTDPVSDDVFVYYHILYAWNVEHDDMRGAAVAILLKTQHLKAIAIIEAAISSVKYQQEIKNDFGLRPNGFRPPFHVDYTQIIQSYAILVNVMSCLQPSDQWIVGEILSGSFTNPSSTLTNSTQTVEIFESNGSEVTERGYANGGELALKRENEELDSDLLENSLKTILFKENQHSSSGLNPNQHILATSQQMGVTIGIEQVVLMLDDIKKESAVFNKRHEQQLMSRVITMDH